jgi:hypothetical protein
MCHTRPRHHRTREHALDRFDAPAPARETGPVRASDAERERVATALRDHAAAGRLDLDELGERLERTYAARYSAELETVLSDLPREPEPRRERTHRGPSAADFAVVPLAIAALVALAIVTSSWWLMWLIWPVVIVLGPQRHYRHGRL